MKKLGRAVLVLIVLLVILGVVGYFSIDWLAARSIEQGATYALGEKTTVDSVTLGLRSGEIRIDGLTVANPEGYAGPHLMKSGMFHVAVEPETITKDTIRVKDFTLDGLDVYIEQKPGGNNVSVILDNIRRFDTKGEGAPEGQPAPEKSGTKVAIDEIVIKNVVAHVQLLPIGGQASTVDVVLDEPIVLKDVTSDGENGAAISEVAARVVPAIISAIVKKSGGAIPADLQANLQQSVNTAMESLGGNAKALMEQAQGGIGGMLQGVLGGKKDASDQSATDKKADGVGGMLEGILGGKKKEEGQ